MDVFWAQVRTLTDSENPLSLTYGQAMFSRKVPYRSFIALGQLCENSFSRGMKSWWLRSEGEAASRSAMRTLTILERAE